MAHVTYIGLDYSTQQLKAILTDSDCNLIHEEVVNFDRDLSAYGTVSGVLRNGLQVYTPTHLWVEATELILRRLKDRRVDLSHVKAISGCGQQHGSVYWREPVEISLTNQGDLKAKLNHSFAICHSPVWMDASASRQCAEIENYFGGPLNFARRTGTKLFSRFTGPVIKRIRDEEPLGYSQTKKISLVSNFAACLLTGHMVPMDYADACGTGFFSLYTAKLDPEVCEKIDAQLMEKIDPPVPSPTVVGNISPFITQNYGIPATCKVVAFTGDNPSCVAGLFLQKGEICLSLGTSDTLFVRQSGPPMQTADTLGIFVMTDPIEPDTYIYLICTRNGAVVRDQLCQQYANGDWNRFSELLKSSPIGNFGYLGLFCEQPEILPENLQGRFLVDAEDKPVGPNFGDPKATFDRAEITIRALIEGQLVRKRAYLARMGMNANTIQRIIVTGGGSMNKEILEIVAGVFGADVYTVNSPNSAALGGAYRAKHALALEESQSNSFNKSSFFDVVNVSPTRMLVARRPADWIVQTYTRLTERFEKLERLAMQSHPK